MYIDPDKVKGWIVVRMYHKGHVHTYDFLEVWASWEDQPLKWHAGYVSDGPQFSHHATVFPTFEKAKDILGKIERWMNEGYKYVMIPTLREPNFKDDPRDTNQEAGNEQAASQPS